jgi:hypothetical protein
LRSSRTCPTADHAIEGDFARVGKKRAGRLLDGREHDDRPEVFFSTEGGAR